MSQRRLLVSRGMLSYSYVSDLISDVSQHHRHRSSGGDRYQSNCQCQLTGTFIPVIFGMPVGTYSA